MRCGGAQRRGVGRSTGPELVYPRLRPALFAIDPERAQPGDRGLVMTPAGPAGVICAGEFWMGPNEAGLLIRRAVVNGERIVKRAWSIA